MSLWQASYPEAVARTRLSIALTLLGAYGLIAARSARPGRRERSLFQAVNDSGEQPWLRVPQQWGTPWTLPVVAVTAASQRRFRHAAVALACLPVAKGTEVATKKLRSRPRPLYVQPTALRDDAPVEGGSMPSGHAAIAACATVLIAPLAPRPVTAVAAIATVLSAVARVQQGAHEPFDAAAGLLLGTGIGLTALEAVRAT